MENVLANSYLFTHPANTEQHLFVVYQIIHYDHWLDAYFVSVWFSAGQVV